MKSRLIQALVFFTSLFIASAGGHPQAAATRKPLTKAQVDDLVAGSADSQRIADAVKDRGIDFKPTDEYLETLAKKGAKPVLLDALRAATPTPLSKSEVLRLLATGKPDEALAAMVQRRGIDFKPGDDDFDTLRIAGAGQALLKAVREAKQVATPIEPLPEASPWAGTEVYGFGAKNVSPATCIYCPDPPYSEEARKAKSGGIVVVQIIVDATGNVRDVRVVKPLGLGLDEKAIESIRTWRFKPAMRNGTPVNVRMLVEVSFRYY